MVPWPVQAEDARLGLSVEAVTPEINTAAAAHLALIVAPDTWLRLCISHKGYQQQDSDCLHGGSRRTACFKRPMIGLQNAQL